MKIWLRPWHSAYYIVMILIIMMMITILIRIITRTSVMVIMMVVTLIICKSLIWLKIMLRMIIKGWWWCIFWHLWWWPFWYWGSLRVMYLKLPWGRVLCATLNWSGGRLGWGEGCIMILGKVRGGWRCIRVYIILGYQKMLWPYMDLSKFVEVIRIAVECGYLGVYVFVVI